MSPLSAEYIWPSGERFRGVAIAGVYSVASLIALYGPTLKMRAHPASDVLSTIGQVDRPPWGGWRRTSSA